MVIIMNKDKKLLGSSNYQEYLIELLKNKKEAKAYLQAALEEYQKDGNNEALLLALRNITEAQGGVSVLAHKSNINRQHLYRILSSKGNPKLQTFGQLLNGLGFHLSVTFDK